MFILHIEYNILALFKLMWYKGLTGPLIILSILPYTLSIHNVQFFTAASSRDGNILAKLLKNTLKI